ncbi:MAG: carboxy terminal-processing peptidase [Pseudomonadales bacterium]|nr:carboxy terminal-processing peptidase [Pseudomonadales bacterium]
MKIIFAFFALLLWSTISLAKSSLPDDLSLIQLKPLSPLSDHSRTSVNILDQLNYAHYNELAIDDNLSSRVFDRYLSDLDSTKSYFLASDIAAFEKYRFIIDDSLKSGNLRLGFEIYNRYQDRFVERLQYVINFLETDIVSIKFDVDEYLDSNREKAAWAKSKADLDELWRKRIKGAILSLKLTDKPVDEIKGILVKRYRSQLNRSLQVNAEDAFQIYMNALAQTYDPHTQYFSPRSSENFNINMSLQLEGIGAVLQNENEYTKVVRLVPGGPADKSKLLKPADKIVGVAQGDGQVVDVIGWRIDEVVQLIRGPKESIVRLQIKSADAENEHGTKVIRIKRNTVKLEDQAARKDIWEIDEGNKHYKMGIINVPTFYIDFKGLQNGDPNYRSTTRDVSRLLAELQKDQVDGLVIDLRNNGGGSLQEAKTMLGLFIRSGPAVQIKDDRGRIDLLRDTDPSIIYNGPLVVLVNRLSASASEIFAGAIQDYERGLIVGSQTFGKGTVQALKSLNRGQLKITQAKFYRISGGSNQHQGIVPDIAFPSQYDHKVIGESALENALTWDTIKSTQFRAFQKLKPVIPLLRTRHEKRIKNDPDFNYLIAQIGILEGIRSDTKIMLNEQTRRTEQKDAEQRRLNLENKRRKAKNEPLIEKMSDLEKEREEKDNSIPLRLVNDNDPLLKETARILADLIKEPKQRYAKQ